MNKTIILYLFFCLTSIDWLQAQTASTHEILNETYHTLLQHPNVRIDSVKYTGDDREKSGGFA